MGFSFRHKKSSSKDIVEHMPLIPIKSVTVEKTDTLRILDDILNRAYENDLEEVTVSVELLNHIYDLMCK